MLELFRFSEDSMTFRPASEHHANEVELMTRFTFTPRQRFRGQVWPALGFNYDLSGPR